MNRLKLFAFYAAMAWVSLIVPAEGRDLIDCAETEKDRQAKEQLLAAQNALVQAQPGSFVMIPAPRAGAPVAVLFWAGLAAAVTGAWLTFLLVQAWWVVVAR